LDIPGNIFLVAILILLTAFFVATEYAIVKSRLTKIEQLVESGNKRAVYAKKLLDQSGDYLSASQLGITFMSLALGWLGGPVVEQVFLSMFTGLDLEGTLLSVGSFLIAFLIVTFAHVVAGELAPKIVAAQKAESILLLFARPLIIFYRVMSPLIWLMNRTSQLLVRLIGIQPKQENEDALSEEEVRMIVEDSYRSGEINLAEMTYVNNIFEFDETVAREIMVPRNEMVCFYKNENMNHNLNIVLEAKFTRYPVANEDKDDIDGFINLKDIFTERLKGGEPSSIETFIRPIIHVPETIPIRQLLRKMQKERIHMAVVTDEYGGTAGIVTVEDILEEIVGDIRDEFDTEEHPKMKELSESTAIVSPKLQLGYLSEKLGIQFSNHDVDTIGGWVYAQEPVVEEGRTVEYAGYSFIVDEMDGYQIRKLKIEKL
jgi:CBS domain containing-hemolysin-like protein